MEILRVSGLTKIYGSGDNEVRALNNVSFSVEKGEFLSKARTMNVFILIAAAIVLIVVLLRFKCPIGPAILAGGALLWLIENPTSAFTVFTGRPSAPSSSASFRTIRRRLS